MRITSVPILCLPPLQQEPGSVLQGYESHLTFLVPVRLSQLVDFVHAPSDQRLKIGVV
ncbi:MAG: hypothetical protein V3U60_09010 [Gammaproteobacteria bacterium]